MDRVILHCDCNSFFASVELLEHPELKDKPEAEVNIAKAYDWSKHYSYDPAGNTYIRSLPKADQPDPRDVKLIYVTVCPKCDTEVEYDNPDTLYTCRNCGIEFKI